MSNRARDPWGDEILDKKKRDAWGDISESSKRDAWGDPVKPAKAAPFPETAALFKPVEKIEGGRSRDAWGAELPERGMPARAFALAVAEAQAVIFEKARPSRPSAEDAALYVDAMTKVLREQSKTDAELVEKLRDCGSWPHQRPTPRRGLPTPVSPPRPERNDNHPREDSTSPLVANTAKRNPR